MILYYSYRINSLDWLAVELIRTYHSGDDYHVRYGLEVTDYPTLLEAIQGMKTSISNLCECESVTYDPRRFRDHIGGRP